MNHITNNPVNVILGTTSANKLKYFKSAADSNLRYDDITPVEVMSGVSDQPIGLDEIQTGADNRARLAFESSGLSNKIGVGLEGGLVQDGDDFYLLCVASIYDGNYFRGISQKTVLPAGVAQMIKEGGEFGVEIRNYQPKPREEPRVKELVSRERSFKKAISQAIREYLLGKDSSHKVYFSK